MLQEEEQNNDTVESGLLRCDAASLDEQLPTRRSNDSLIFRKPMLQTSNTVHSQS